MYISEGIFDCLKWKHSLIYFRLNSSYLVFWEAGVAEVELTSVVTEDVKRVVPAGWWDKEASGSGGKPRYIHMKGAGHGVDPLCPVSSCVLIVAPDVSQVTGSRIVPHLHLQASSTWVYNGDKRKLGAEQMNLLIDEKTDNRNLSKNNNEQ